RPYPQPAFPEQIQLAVVQVVAEGRVDEHVVDAGVGDRRQAGTRTAAHVVELPQRLVDPGEVPELAFEGLDRVGFGEQRGDVEGAGHRHVTPLAKLVGGQERAEPYRDRLDQVDQLPPMGTTGSGDHATEGQEVPWRVVV